MRYILVGLLASLSACTSPQSRARWIAPSASSRPATATEVRAALAHSLEAGDRRGATVGLFRLANMGATLSPESQARLAPLFARDLIPSRWRWSDAPLASLAGDFRFNARPIGDDRRFAEVPARYRLIEGIAWDPPSRRLFVGAVVDRRLLVHDDSGWREVPTAAPLGGVFGMAIDAPRRLLWLASSPADPIAATDPVYSGLVAIDLDRTVEARRIAVPDAHLGDVTVAADGTVFASDGQSGAIYRCRPGCASAETLVPAGLLRSPQGMALSPHGHRLYIADYSLGLLGLDLATLRIRRLHVRTEQMLDGIDGLVRNGRKLIAIQNGTRPHRIVSISLSDDGGTVESVHAFSQNQPGWSEPTLGVIADGALLYVDGHWPFYEPGRNGAGEPEGTIIRRVELPTEIIVTGS